MISLTTGQLETWLDQVLWPFIRVGSCLMVAPVFSGQTVPVRIRIVLAGAIALILAPMIAIPQGLSADLIATLHGYTRNDVDAIGAISQQRASAAWA